LGSLRDNDEIHHVLHFKSFPKLNSRLRKTLNFWGNS
jgi:hypothetical protein